MIETANLAGAAAEEFELQHLTPAADRLALAGGHCGGCVGCSGCIHLDAE